MPTTAIQHQVKYIDVGFDTQTGPSGYGWSEIGSLQMGSISNTIDGTLNKTVPRLYGTGNADVRAFYATPTSDQVYLIISGLAGGNSGWDRVQTSLPYNTNTFNRTDASYSSNTTGNYRTWVWSGITADPFGQTTGANVTVTFFQDVNTTAALTGQPNLTKLEDGDNTDKTFSFTYNTNTKYRAVLTSGVTTGYNTDSYPGLPYTAATRNTFTTGGSSWTFTSSDLPLASTKATYKLQVGTLYADFDDHTSTPSLWRDCVATGISGGVVTWTLDRDGSLSDIKYVQSGSGYTFDGFSDFSGAGFYGDISDTDEPGTVQRDQDYTPVITGSQDINNFYLNNDGTFRFFSEGTSGSASNSEWEYISVEDEGLLFREDATYTRGGTAESSLWLWAAADVPYASTPFNTSSYTRVVFGCSRFPHDRISSTTTQGFYAVKLVKNGTTQIGTLQTDTGGTASFEIDASGSVEPGDVLSLIEYYVSDSSSASCVSGFNGCASNESTIVTQGGFQWFAGGGTAATDYLDYTIISSDTGSPTSIGSVCYNAANTIHQRVISFPVTSTHTFLYYRYLPHGDTNRQKETNILIDVNITPPVIDDIQTSAALSPPSGTFDVTVDLSNLGTGPANSLEFAQTTNAVAPSTGWQTSNVFTQSRNTTRYYWASRDKNAAGSFDGPEPAAGLFEPYLTAYTGIEPLYDFEIPNSFTNFTIFINTDGAFGATETSYTTYEIRETSYTGTVLVTQTGLGGSLVVPDAPADNSTKRYYVTAFVDDVYGGNPTETRSNIQTFDITAQANVDDYGLEIYNSNQNLVFSSSDAGNIRVLESGTTGSISAGGTFTIDLQGRSGGYQNLYVTAPEIDSFDTYSFSYNYSSADQGATNDTATINNDSSIALTFGYVFYRYI